MTDRNEASSSAAHAEHKRETDTRFAYRRLGWPWLLALLLVPLVLAALLVGLRGGKIEDNLQDRSVAALSSAGLAGVQVDFAGRDATLSLPDGSVLSAADLDKATGVVGDVDGVRVANADADSGTSGNGWLFGQLWFLLFLFFLVGSVVTWLVARFTLPHEDALEAETGLVSEGLL